MRIEVGSQVLEFVKVPLQFKECRASDLFALKNNKTVDETLRHRKYAHLAKEVLASHPDCLQRRLGELLLDLKKQGQTLYKRFLNAYGDDAYCRFSLGDSPLSKQKGLYCFVSGEKITYVGKSVDCYARRINQGYGQIHPKNCYRDGQATNCHLNTLIAKYRAQIAFFACPMGDVRDIEAMEKVVIAQEKPAWNVQLT